MRWLALLLLVPLAAAGGTHDGPEPTTVAMYVHHTEGGLFLNPAVPGATTLAPSQPPACDAPAVWVAPFTRDPSDPEADALARPAALDTFSPRLRWFMETVRPGSEEPMPALPTPWTLTAELVAGTPSRVMASGSTDQTTAVTVDGRSVVKADIALGWADKADTTLPVDGVALRVTARMDDPCGAGPVGLRPFADESHQARIIWDLFDPVRLEHFETGWSGDTLMIRVHASSPWGAHDLAAPRAPVLTTPSGAKVDALLDALDDAGTDATWAWDASTARNGTYRIDVKAARADGSSGVDAWSTFRIGGDAPPIAPTTPPTKATPAPAVPFLLAAVVLARRIS